MEKRHKSLLLRSIKWATLTAAVILAGSVPRFYDYYKKNAAAPAVLYIYPGGTYRDLLDSIGTKLKDTASFAKIARKEGLDTSCQPGRYRLEAGMNNKELVRMLRNGWQTPMRLTLSGNIRTLERLAGILGKKLAADSLDFLAHFNDSLTWREYGLDRQTFLSLFIPNTYEVYWTITPAQFTQRMKKENDRFWTEERTAKAQALGLTREEVSTLASIVCEESNYKPERPDIAGVYINRLKKGMKLDADPTIKFALGDPSIRRILFKHLEVESPYNTYKYPGLPPGPITIPDINSLDAVLNYREHNYLYFCASEKLDGTHKFATNLTDHNKNAKAYQRAISRL